MKLHAYSTLANYKEVYTDVVKGDPATQIYHIAPNSRGTQFSRIV